MVIISACHAEDTSSILVSTANKSHKRGSTICFCFSFLYLLHNINWFKSSSWL